MVRLYIIDDHYLIEEGLYSSFNLESEDFKVVGGSLTIEDALNNISLDNVDIIVLDLFLQQSNPISNYSKLKEDFPSIYIVVLTHDNSLLWKIQMFILGAKAFINKEEDKSVMKQKLLRVAAGETLIPPDLSQILIPGNLNQISFQLMQEYIQIIAELANGMTIKQIALKLKKSDSYIEKKLQNIREYFKVKTNCELVSKFSTKQLPLLFS